MALQKTVDTWKLKKWFTVYAPKEFNEAQIAEMPANDESRVIGRNIRIGLSTITNNPSHAYTEVVLKVTDVNGEAAHTKIVRLEQVYSYIRSLVRRYKSISDGVFNVSTNDGTKEVAKILIITRGRTAHTKLVGMRKESKDFLEAYCKEKSLKEVLDNIISGKLQSELGAKVSHIAPISKIEVKKLEIVG
jgi:small subunit ribosomal protein S3Ae